MGHATSKHKSINPELLKPQGLYSNTKDIDLKRLKRHILDRKIAPCFKGSDFELNQVRSQGETRASDVDATGNCMQLLICVLVMRVSFGICTGERGVLHMHVVLPSIEPDQVLLQGALHRMFFANQEWHRVQDQRTLPVLQRGFDVSAAVFAVVSALCRAFRHSVPVSAGGLIHVFCRSVVYKGPRSAEEVLKAKQDEQAVIDAQMRARKVRVSIQSSSRALAPGFWSYSEFSHLPFLLVYWC